MKGSPRNVKKRFSAALLWQTKIAGTSVPHKQASVTWNMGFLLRKGRWHKYHSYRMVNKTLSFKMFCSALINRSAYVYMHLHRNMTELLNWNGYFVDMCQTWKVRATKTVFTIKMYCECLKTFIHHLSKILSKDPFHLFMYIHIHQLLKELLVKNILSNYRI